MYRRFYNKASEMADLIQERLGKPETREGSALTGNLRQGLVRRRENVMDTVYPEGEEGGIPDMIASYIANIRQSNPAEAVEEYIREQSEPEAESDRDSGTWDFEEIEDFAQRLAMSESSGRSGIQIQSRGQNMTGLFQFSDGRLEDYMNDTGASFTTEEFRQDPELQRDVFAWHINDIDRVIQENNLLDRGFDRDGLRAVAHLGGITGMLRYARTGGTYNPADDFGTSLNDYYNRFSGN